MLDIINRIKNKTDVAMKDEQQKKESPKAKKADANIPTLKPMAFDGNLKINFCSTREAMELDKEERMQQQRKKHDAANFAKKTEKNEENFTIKAVSKEEEGNEETSKRVWQRGRLF